MNRHPYTRTVIEHHDDGSHTVRHEHKDGMSHNSYAKADLDQLHDGLEDNLNIPEEQEEDLEEAVHPGLHDEMKEHLEEEQKDPGIHARIAKAIGNKS